jgi:hypothetical protein
LEATYLKNLGIYTKTSNKYEKMTVREALMRSEYEDEEYK